MTADPKVGEAAQPQVAPLENPAPLQARILTLVTGLSALPEDQMRAERWRVLLLDEEAALVMVAFFELLISGESRARALLSSLLIARNQLPLPRRFALGLQTEPLTTAPP